MTISPPFHLKRSIARTLALSLAAGTVLSVATTRADDADFDKASQFVDAVQRSIDVANQECKVELALTTNISTVDLTPYAPYKGAPPKRVMREVATACQAAIDGVQTLCSFGREKAAWQAVVSRELKGVRCQFTGHQARKAGEDEEVWARRNVTYANGVLTVLMGPGLRRTSDAAVAAVKAGLAGKPGAPAVDKDVGKTGGNGEQCTRADDCGSGVCAKSVCAPCSATAKCRKGTSCDDGICRTPQELQRVQELREMADEQRAQERSAPAPAAKATVKGSAKGRMCSKDKDCQSGACKMENKTRGRCQ